MYHENKNPSITEKGKIVSASHGNTYGSRTTAKAQLGMATSTYSSRGGHIFTINRKPNRTVPNRNFGFLVVRFGFGFVSKKFSFRYRNRFSPYTEPKKPNTELYQFSNLIRLCELIV
jgi:hypothetical protein